MSDEELIEWLRHDVYAVSNASTDKTGHIIMIIVPRHAVRAALDRIAALEAENAQLRNRLAHFAALVNGNYMGGLAGIRFGQHSPAASWHPQMSTADILYIADGGEPPA